MMPDAPVDSVARFWQCFDDADFDGAGRLMRPDAVVLWPNTREIFRGRDGFIAINKQYPGRWRTTIEQMILHGDTVISVVRVDLDRVTGAAAAGFHVVSFFEFKDGLISQITEYWGEDGEPPAWRARAGLSERY